MINEASLSRVWKHFNDPNTTIVILTGFRAEKTLEENERANRFIASKLRNAGFGFFYVDGYWIENEGTPEEIKVKEDSIFAICKDPNKSKNLIDLAHQLANKYNQDAIFVKSPAKGVYLLFKNGKEEKLDSEMKPGKLGSMYTKLRNNKKANTFIFETERDGNSFMKMFKEKLIKENHV